MTLSGGVAIASTFEGHRMAKDGRAAKALATAAVGAFVGGLIATTLVVFFAPTLVKMATASGPAEYFALAVFAFLAISSVVSESVVKGLASLGIGLVLALGEVLHIAGRIHRDPVAQKIETKGKVRLNGTDFRKALPA